MKSTKELARELGLIRKHSTSFQSGGKRLAVPVQPFAYLIVIDFESTCWEDKKTVDQEIIEFPALLLNTTTGKIEDEFHYYCLPEEHPVLSAFCTKLTGITQEQVEKGIPLFLCLSKFQKWLKKLETEKLMAFNSSPLTDKKLCTFVTWSDWDLGVCLHNECRRKTLHKPGSLNSWIDLRAVYKKNKLDKKKSVDSVSVHLLKFYQRTPHGLHGALKDLGIEFAGREHSGLDDARNTAQLVWRMICDGCLLKITKTMPGAIKKFQLPKSRAVSKFSTETELQKNTVVDNNEVVPFHVTASEAHANSISTKNKSQFRPAATRKDDTRLKQIQRKNATESLGGGNSETVPSSESFQKFHKTSRSYEKSSPSLRHHHQAEEDKKTASSNQTFMHRNLQSKPCSSQSSQVRHLGMRKRSELKRTSSQENSKPPKVEKKLQALEETIQIGISRSNFPIHKEDLPSNTKVPSLKSPQMFNTGIPLKFASFKTPSPVTKELTSKVTLTRTPLRNISNKTSPYSVTPSGITPYKSILNSKSSTFKFATPVNQSSYKVTQKVTPPLCQCGKRSRRKTVSSPGPYQGRAFFSCSLGQRAKGPNFNQFEGGCGFFKWESVVLQNLGTPKSCLSFGFNKSQAKYLMKIQTSCR